ncbi:MAG: hypothetical protein WCH85_10570 [Methanomicrobiales archaeon]
MKTAFTVLLVILAVLSCGCTATAPAVPATTVSSDTKTAQAIPDLTGNWTSTSSGYDEGTGFTDYSNMSMSLRVTEQRDRLFSGNLVFKYNGSEESTLSIAGAIGRDGRTVTFVEKDAGYSFGTILSPNEIEMTYVDEVSPYSIAVNSFKRA